MTYAFLHDPSNLFHLLFNMLALVMFGAPLEYTWGNRRYASYYFTCVVGAALCQLAVGYWQTSCGIRRRPRSVRRVACSDCCSHTGCCSRTSA